MREIKLRAWDKKENDWFDDDDGDLFIEMNGYINFGWNGEIMEDYTDRIILMQYTGLKDINGVEIYEGDIVCDRYGNYYTPIFRNGIYMAYNVSYLNLSEHEPSTQFNVVWKARCKVIGNIYEIPELLED